MSDLNSSTCSILSHFIAGLYQKPLGLPTLPTQSCFYPYSLTLRVSCPALSHNVHSSVYQLKFQRLLILSRVYHIRWCYNNISVLPAPYRKAMPYRQTFGFHLHVSRGPNYAKITKIIALPRSRLHAPLSRRRSDTRQTLNMQLNPATARPHSNHNYPLIN